MKRIGYQFIYPVARPMAAVVLLATLALATPSRAASVGLSQAATAGTPPALLAQATTTQAPAATGQVPGSANAAKAPRADRVEARINDLHTKLGITPAQENLWKDVVQAMRDNAKTMEALTKARAEKAKTMTAIDDLKSYGEIAEAHADGIRKFIPVFEALYNGMSDAQKKEADTVFRGHGRSRTASKKTTGK